MAQAVGDRGAEAMQLQVEGIFGVAACVYFAAEFLQCRTEGLSDELAGVGLLESEKIRTMEELAYLGELAIEIGRMGLHGLTVYAQDKASVVATHASRTASEFVSDLRILDSSIAVRALIQSANRILGGPSRTAPIWCVCG